MEWNGSLWQRNIQDSYAFPFSAMLLACQVQQHNTAQQQFQTRRAFPLGWSEALGRVETEFVCFVNGIIFWFHSLILPCGLCLLVHFIVLWILVGVLIDFIQVFSNEECSD